VIGFHADKINCWELFLILEKIIWSEAMDFKFKIEKDGEEFHAFAPDLPGCHTHGKTPNVALNNLKDAVNLYISVIIEEQLSEQIAEFEFES
jgi:predicted RNase H-like HicB family nuclease